MTIKKGVQGFLYVVEVVLLYLMTQTPHFYGNHLNFMRSVLYRSHLIEENYLWIIQLLPPILLVIVGRLLWRKRTLHGWLALILSISYAGLTWGFSRSVIPSYFVILLLLLVVVILQIVQVLMSRMGCKACNNIREVK
ncbi:MAG: hypothetical protein Q4A55_01655 [Aerococcus sp.]|nr:hypothetical protein [Aerococcus sp.]